MMKFSRGAKICTFISVFLIFLAIILLRPLHKRLDSFVNGYVQQVSEMLYEKAGITVSYKTFSPSILASFQISGIKCTDKDDKDVVVIDSLILNYKLWNIIRGRYSDVIQSLKMEGIKVDIGRILDITSRITEDSNSDEPKKDDNLEKQEFSFNFKDIANFIPELSTFKDIVLIYNDDAITSSYYLDEISLTNSKNKQLIEALVTGKMELLVKESNLNVDGDIFIAGSITHNLENSTAKITASNFDVWGYKISKQNLLATYKNDEIELHSIQTVNPLYIWGSYNLKDMVTKAGFKTENLAPMSVFSTKDKNLENMIKDFRLSVDFSMEYDLIKNTFDYSSDGNVYIPPRFVPDGLYVNYDVTGDLKSVHANQFNATGNLCNVASTFDFIFDGLKLDGFFDIIRFTLPNGNTVKAQIYADPLPTGFMIFSPEIFIGEKTLTGLEVKLIPQNDSIDFEFEVADYAVLNKDEVEKQNADLQTQTGKIEIDGSYILSSNYAQANVSLNSISVYSVIEYIQELVDSDTRTSLEGIKDFANPYLFTGDVYVSTDLNSISYNVPYILVANTREDNQYIFASANGNEQSVQINRFDLIFGNNTISLTGSLDFEPESKNMFFDAEVIAGSVPYHLSGNIDGTNITVAGDYGLEAFINLGSDKIDGTLSVANLPFFVMDNSFIFSLDTLFEYDAENGPQIQCSKLEIEKSDINTSINPKVTIAGSGTKYGAQLSSIVYSDKYSIMDGAADIKVNFNEQTFNSGAINMQLINAKEKERINVEVSISNPEEMPLNLETLMKDLYFNANIDINNFSMSRFTQINNENNRLTGNISITGTAEHPYAMVSLNKMTLVFGGDTLTAKGDILLEDNLISILNTSFAYPTLGVNNISGEIDIDKFEGKIKGNFFMGNKKARDLEIPLTISIYDAYYMESQFIPDIFTVTVETDDITGQLIKKTTKFDITMNYSPDLISIFSSDNIGFVGTYIPASGEIFGSIDSPGITSFDLGGIVTFNELDTNISNIKIDLKKLMAYFNMDETIKIENGLLEGALHLGGNLDSPDITGALTIAKPKVRLPGLFDQVLSTDVINLTATGDKITMEKFNVAVKNNTPRFTFTAYLGLNKWAIDTIFFNLENLPKQTIPLRYKDGIYTLNGNLVGNVDFFNEKNVWEVTGSIFADDVDFVIDGAALATAPVIDENSPGYFDVRTDLDLNFGTHVSVNVKPLLRAILVPNTNFNLKVDTDAGKYEIDGELKIRSGEIAYLQRNFYIKEGSFKFNPEDLSNPVITLRAETREKDEKGQQVKIIFSVENQTLQNLDPKFSAIPGKSETEIMTLLGQVMKTDSDNIGDVLLSVGDYYIQSTVMSGIENKLRDLFNFDIFSIRTNFLQNTFGILGTNNTVGSEKQNITIGNFLDNSTVYIGKYLGSALYVDGMLHLSLDDADSNDISTIGNLTLKPEIGLELDLPIANIRWSMAPDINALLNNQYVPSTALTLSWKFNF